MFIKGKTYFVRTRTKELFKEVVKELEKYGFRFNFDYNDYWDEYRNNTCVVIAYYGEGYSGKCLFYGHISSSLGERIEIDINNLIQEEEY